MRSDRKILPILLTAGLGAGAALGIRLFVLSHSLEAGGMLLAGSPALIWTVVFSLAITLALGGQCLYLNRAPGGADCFGRDRIPAPAFLPAALLVWVGCMLRLLAPQEALSSTQKLIEILGALGGLALGAAAMYRDRLGRKAFWLLVLPALYTLTTLLSRFRAWGYSPSILTVLPKLLCLCCCAMAMMLLTAFSLGVGHKRSTICFGLLAGVFFAMSLPDFLRSLQTTAPDLFLFAGLTLWALTHSLVLLRRENQSQPLPEPGDSTEEPEPVPEEKLS